VYVTASASLRLNLRDLRSGTECRLSHAATDSIERIETSLHLRQADAPAEADRATQVMAACSSSPHTDADSSRCNDIGVMGDELVQWGNSSTFDEATNSAQLFYRSDKDFS